MLMLRNLVSNIKKSINKISGNDTKVDLLLRTKKGGDHMKRDSQFVACQVCFSGLIALSSRTVIADSEFQP